MNNIYWSEIRPLNGSQRDGFEELCAQLARLETPPEANFVRTGNPDSGVECYCTFENGDEWGWQAKYFLHSTGVSQWQQIKNSVNAALHGHPSLTRYIVCLPIDLPDRRSSNGRSARQRWDELVQEWKQAATQSGMSVEFELWDASALISRLTKPEHAGTLRYWFDTTVFDDAWFRSRLDESKNAAGARYTPEVHVSTSVPATEALETFARTENGINHIKSLAVEIRRRTSCVSQAERERLESEHGLPFSGFAASVAAVLEKFAYLQYEPFGQYPFGEIVADLDSAIGSADQIEEQLQNLAFEEGMRSQDQHASNNYQNTLGRFRYIPPELRKAKTEIELSAKFANSNLMILTGKAGVGKTHLLCDFAERQLSSGTPTILLMGQRFTSADDPIRQIIAQLDYPQDGTFEEFVRALESAAKVAGRRALVILDALNEGQGKTLWEPNLAALIDRIGKSPWIGLLLSVREEYLTDVIPDEVRNQAPISTHYGFEGIEFDAVKTFFEYYNLELPSTPILQPEFSNPLWLKVICEGLQSAGEKRLPRGMHGITKPLGLYTEAINQNLAKPDALDYDASGNLVEQAVIKLAERMMLENASWLDRTDAQETVDQLLPNRTFSKSLYHGLATEGILTEVKGYDGNSEVVVFAYERIADHLKVKFLLSEVDADSAKEAFEKGGPLEFVNDGTYVPGGIIEALHTQVPERTGKELVELCPKLGKRFNAVEAFSQSVIWRSPCTVTDTTKRILSELVQRREGYWNPALEALLTIAVVQDHPLNIEYLDHLLSSYEMADRDAWWSVHLHRSWGNNGPVDRLIEWALSANPRDLDDQAIDLATTTLAWTLTASNRFVRDNATKALVSLLDGRLTAVESLVGRFADVDDPYVTERIYAVAYGVAMRNSQASEVGRLAELVYNRVFAQGTPPPHMMTRDYARGVIERASYLGADLDIDWTVVRPPYKSTWPEIPSQEETESLKYSMEKSSGENPNAEPGWWQIRFSLGSGDFARYIIGTNSSHQSRDWLTMNLDEPRWEPYDQRRATLVSQLDAEERTALDEYDKAHQAATVFPKHVFVSLRPDEEGNIPQESLRILHVNEDHVAKHLVSRIKLLMAKGRLVTTLSKDHLSKWRMLDRQAPRLDLKVIQRYILSRVIKLGWNTERFGDFDQLVDRMQNPGRRAHKAERIGKKYQWIAYHEILALISDRYQYHPEWEEPQEYDGPWQMGLRDIDPSAVLPSGTRSPDSTAEHPPTWWAPMEYDNWQPSIDTEHWVADDSDVPDLDKNLVVEDPSAPGARWINAACLQSNRQPHPADFCKYDVEGREVWLKTTAYLVPKGKADDFIEWVMSGRYWTNEWVSFLPATHGVFLGEHAWSRSSNQQYEAYNKGQKEWPYPEGADSVPASTLVAIYSTAFSEYDCSVGENEGNNLYLPSPSIIRECALRWSGNAADYVDNEGAVAALDPAAHESGPNALLIRTDVLEKFMEDHELELCWTVIGEKQSTGTIGQPHGWLKAFGAYVYRDGQPLGKHQCQFNPPNPQ